MKIRSIYYLIILAVAISSCNNDEEITVALEPPRPLSEVFSEDEAELQQYFSTHFYNYEEFQNPQAGFDFVIKIDTLAGDNSNKTSLKDSPSFGFKTLTVTSNQVGIDNSESIEHKIYYIIARQGVGPSTTFADSTYVDYEGSLLNGTVFESSRSPIWFDLTRNIPGFYHGITSLKAGSGFIENGDGTVNVLDYGIGVIFIPSALAYYARGSESGNIPPYSPIIFKLNLYAVNQSDHDRDGIPSYLEDLNGNGRLNDDNTNSDQERPPAQFIPNFFDPNDDGDNKLTRDEIIINADGSITFPDTDGDGIPDYLDKDS